MVNNKPVFRDESTPPISILKDIDDPGIAEILSGVSGRGRTDLADPGVRALLGDAHLAARGGRKPYTLATILPAFGEGSGRPALFAGLLVCVFLVLLITLGALAVQFVVDGVRGSFGS